ncbi:ABC transporter substrate-binding protein [Paenibacillus radicis (ex Xue et al. 2023)]|uniref:ABC transporter substrate-binding protein n=1 Tax=Paenibacillus radicis (ex Xue et al. 2023) TaxID=2972489 RepID=A0ABT1Y9W6_9BACL|nr:ABC transporter substrate-binding protein [Paenibacillus radicis (ex Xue et al. 2023)]MCR8629981.1 ABC transporter substrate-binding protein [Paenibacillus radicis (ex Xue et al. 2023)]
MKRKNKIIMGAAAVSLMATMTACSTGGNTTAPAKDAGGNKDGKPVEITFANWISVEDATKDAYAKLIADFEQKHPTIKVKSLGIPFAQFKDQVLVNSAGGTPPDVTMANQNFTAAFAGANITEPLEEALGKEFVDDIVAGSRAGVTYSGKVMAMPWAPHPNALFWNKTLFKKAGLDPEKPPKTYDELISYAKKIAALGKDEKGNPIYGIGENSSTESYTGNMLLRTALSYGGKFVDDKGAVVYDQGSALKDTLAYYKDMINNKVSPKGAAMKDLRGMFANGTLGILIDGDFGRSSFRTMSGKGETFDKEWGVSIVPVGKTGRSETVFTEHQLIITKTGKQKAAAAELVKYLVSKDAMLIYHKTNGIMSSRKSIAALPEMNEDDYAKVFNEQMKTASPLPAANPKFDNAMKESSDMIVLVTEGNKSPEEAITTVISKIKDLYK